MLDNSFSSSRFIATPFHLGRLLLSLALRRGALAALIVALLTTAASATAIVPISSDNWLLRDTTGDDLGDSLGVPSTGQIAVGEANNASSNTTENRYWMPFDLTTSQRDAIASAALVLVETQLDEKNNTSGLWVDTWGFSGRTSTVAAVNDYQTAASLLQSNSYEDATPLGRQAVDITSLAKQEAAAPGGVLALRTQIAPAASVPSNDNTINNFIVSTQQSGTASKRPVLTVVPGGQAWINDDFNNGAVGNGGTNGGFSLVSNGVGGTGAASELASHAIVTASGGSNNSGLVSNHSFDPGTGGFHAVWVVTSTGVPNANGVNLTLQANPGFINNSTGQPNLLFRFGGSGSEGAANGFRLLAHDGDSQLQLASDTFTASTLYDGFTLVASILPTGWEYTLVGLDGLTNSTFSGSWGTNHNFATLFDADTHIGAFIQTSSTPRNLTLDRIAVFAAATAVPEPGTFGLALAGLALAAGTARRYRRSSRAHAAH